MSEASENANIACRSQRGSLSTGVAAGRDGDENDEDDVVIESENEVQDAHATLGDSTVLTWILSKALAVASYIKVSLTNTTQLCTDAKAS